MNNFTRAARAAWAVLVLVLSGGCSSQDTAANCAEIQKECLARGMCLESTNRGATEGEGQYGDNASGSAKDEAECDIRCIRCELVGTDGGGGQGGTDGGAVTGGTAGQSSGSGGTGAAGGSGASGGTSGATSTGGSAGSGTGGSSGAFDGSGGACGLRSAVTECMDCLEAQVDCCSATGACAGEEACVWVWSCYQACEQQADPGGCTFACRNSTQYAQSTKWGALNNCVVTRCATGTTSNACPAFAL